MSIETVTKYTSTLYELMNAFDDKISDIALNYRVNVIGPFCEKYNLKFYSGNGTYFFERLDTGENIDDDDLLAYYCSDWREDDNEVQLFWEELGDIYTVLNVEIYDTKFGYNVCFELRSNEVLMKF